jgi:hypothetical protein
LSSLTGLTSDSEGLAELPIVGHLMSQWLAVQNGIEFASEPGASDGTASPVEPPLNQEIARLPGFKWGIDALAAYI